MFPKGKNDRVRTQIILNRQDGIYTALYRELLLQRLEQFNTFESHYEFKLKLISDNIDWLGTVGSI